MVRRGIQFVTRFITMLVLVTMLALTMMSNAADSGDYGFHSEFGFGQVEK